MKWIDRIIKVTDILHSIALFVGIIVWLGVVIEEPSNDARIILMLTVCWSLQKFAWSLERESLKRAIKRN